MRNKVLIGAVLILTFSMTASAWDVLGSAYVMEMIRGGAGNAPGNELYGSTAPDFVNYMIGTPYYSFCYDLTHKDFMRAWHMSGNGIKSTELQKVALGFVSHNGLWGSDYIAHVSALSGDTTKGYVINQAIFLEQVYAQAGVWAALGIADGPYELKLELCHNIVEYIIDVQVWLHDPTIAGRVVAAASGRDSGFPALVTRAYSKLLADFSQTTEAPLSVPAAAAWIQGYEAAFQQREVLYASLYASAVDMSAVMTNLSGYLSVLANTVFGLSTTPAEVEQILGLAFTVLPNAIGELNATAEFVKGGLAAHHVVYGPKGIMSRVDADLPKGLIRK
ncbi:MAG TPA: hypothetical protein VKT17_08880 [Acidobacteriota bacterium]|nr:hypothetical protein [Acidobacteriota bacterium]